MSFEKRRPAPSSRCTRRPTSRCSSGRILGLERAYLPPPIRLRPALLLLPHPHQHPTLHPRRHPPLPTSPTPTSARARTRSSSSRTASACARSSRCSSGASAIGARRRRVGCEGDRGRARGPRRRGCGCSWARRGGGGAHEAWLGPVGSLASGEGRVRLCTTSCAFLCSSCIARGPGAAVLRFDVVGSPSPDLNRAQAPRALAARPARPSPPRARRCPRRAHWQGSRDAHEAQRTASLARPATRPWSASALVRGRSS